MLGQFLTNALLADTVMCPCSEYQSKRLVTFGSATRGLHKIACECGNESAVGSSIEEAIQFWNAKCRLLQSIRGHNANEIE